VALAMHVLWDLHLGSPQVDVETFHDLGARLMSELITLEEIETDLVDPAVSTEADRGAIVVELVIRGSDFSQALQRAVDIVEAAMHAIGGGTARWPTPDELGFTYRPGPLRADPAESLATV
jgi:hypothetical protein